jgi:hypothetical protein
MVEGDEECDGLDAAACGTGGFCGADCACVCPGFFSFTTQDPGTLVCGRTNASVSGNGTTLAQLACGALSTGGGVTDVSIAPTITNVQLVYKVADACGSAAVKNLQPTTVQDTGSNRNCTSPGCFFGAPISIAGPPPVCVASQIGTGLTPSGTLNPATGRVDLRLSFLAKVTVAPGACPRCLNNLCATGPSAGRSCTPDNAVTLTSHDCPPTGTPINLSVSLNPLQSTSSVVTAANGVFCPLLCNRTTDPNCTAAGVGQRDAGAFDQPLAHYIEVGPPAGQTAMPLRDLLPHPATLSANFCVPSLGAPILDGPAGLPGPGAASFFGTNQLHETWP